MCRTNGWRWEQVDEPHYTWYARLFEDSEFLQHYIDRWSELRSTVFATSNILERIDQLAEQLCEAPERNNQRWPIFGKLMDQDGDRGPDHQTEVNWLKRWLTGRLAWIDSQDFPKPKAERFVENGATKLRLTGAGGRVFYTLDGSDPRKPGGSVSPLATEYRVPITLTTDTHVCARVRSDYNLWSAPTLIEAKYESFNSWTDFGDIGLARPRKRDRPQLSESLRWHRASCRPGGSRGARPNRSWARALPAAAARLHGNA